MAVDSGPASAASGKALVVITSSVGRAAVADKFKATAVPVMVMKSGVMMAMGMSSLDGETDPGPGQIAIAAAADPLAAALTGKVSVYTNANQRIVWGTPGAMAAKVATVPGMADQAAIYGYEAGQTMVGTDKAPARRLGFFCHLSGNTSASGLKLFDAAVTWALQ
jgi:hypothetical protein